MNAIGRGLGHEDLTSRADGNAVRDSQPVIGVGVSRSTEYANKASETVENVHAVIELIHHEDLSFAVERNTCRRVEEAVASALATEAPQIRAVMLEHVHAVSRLIADNDIAVAVDSNAVCVLDLSCCFALLCKLATIRAIGRKAEQASC